MKNQKQGEKMRNCKNKYCSVNSIGEQKVCMDCKFNNKEDFSKRFSSIFSGQAGTK